MIQMHSTKAQHENPTQIKVLIAPRSGMRNQLDLRCEIPP